MYNLIRLSNVIIILYTALNTAFYYNINSGNNKNKRYFAHE